MLNTRFGVEIEFTGITRKEAAQKAKKVLRGEVRYIGTYYDAWSVDAPDGRTWKFMSDASIMAQKKKDGTVSTASKYYSVELVTPILYHMACHIHQEHPPLLQQKQHFALEECTTSFLGEA